jgi:hypothetical protein
VIGGRTGSPGTAPIRTPIARPNAGTSSASVGTLSGEAGRRIRGSFEPLAGPKRTYAASPEKNTTGAEMEATASVTPVFRRYTGTSATTGTSAIESAAE